MTAIECPKTITTIEDARQLVEFCIQTVGMGYHPDTPAGQYVDPITVEGWDRLHQEAFDNGFGDELYDHGMLMFQQIGGV